MGYTKQALKGFSWIGGFRGITRVVTLLKLVLLSRLLTPYQFGLYGIASLVLSLIEIVTETGINIFLTQQKEDVNRYINTAWFVSILRGLIIGGLILILSWPVAQFFNAESSLPLLMLISVVPLIRGFINPSVVKFLIELDFKKEFYYRTGIFMTESLFSIIGVFIFQSPIGLVWGLVAGALFEVTLSFYFASPQPKFEYKTEIFRTIISHGKWMTASGIFNYLYHNVDKIMVGRILGPASLGVYDRGYQLARLPLTEVADVFGKVTFPVYVKISDDKARLRRAYIRSVLVITTLTIPLGLLCILFPQQIVRVLLGEQWMDVAIILPVLAIFGVVRAISFSAIEPFYAVKKQKYVTIVTFVSVIGMVLTIVPFIYWFGLVGAGYSAVFGAVIAIPVIMYLLSKILYGKVS